MLEKLELSQQQHELIKAHCEAIGIEFFSTPFSVAAVDMLVGLGVRRLKLSSGELTHRALVEHAAATRLPLLMSTGMGTMEEISEAVEWIQAVRGTLKDVVVLHCTSAYPAPDGTLNLRAMVSMASNLGVATGYSDHSLGIEAPLAAVALGAVVIEKHLTLDRDMPGPDHSASLEPTEFAQMVSGIRRVSAMLGDGIKAPLSEELDTAKVARRSVVAAVDIAAGEFPPDRTYMDTWDAHASFEAMGEAKALDGRPGTKPGMHVTETLDYAIVLSGEIWAVMDVDETLLQAGDVLIQRGTNHAWSNRGEEPALVAFVLMDARAAVSANAAGL
ncbi:NeuB family protein [Ostertagia ostertagi]